MSQRVRVGLIGCGRISGRHVQWSLEHPDCDIVAVCDESAQAAEAAAAAIRQHLATSEGRHGICH